MEECDKLIYCINNPVLILDEVTSQMRYGIYDNWVHGVDDFLEEIIYDDTGWESICSDLGLYLEDEDGYYRDYDSLTRREWDMVYEMYLNHMTYYFAMWWEQPDVHNDNLNAFFEKNKEVYYELAKKEGHIWEG